MKRVISDADLPIGTDRNRLNPQNDKTAKNNFYKNPGKKQSE